MTISALLALIGSKATLIGGFVAACLAALGVMFRFAFKAGKNSQLAKEGQANAKAIDDLARANAARAGANTDSLSNDGFRRD